MDYERFFPASPPRVVSALLEELSARGQVLHVGEFGTAVTFIPSQAILSQGRHLVARAHEWPQGTLVQVTEAEHNDVVDDDAEFMDLLAVLGEVARVLDSPRPRRRTTGMPLAHGSLPAQREQRSDDV